MPRPGASAAAIASSVKAKVAHWEKVVDDFLEAKVQGQCNKPFPQPPHLPLCAAATCSDKGAEWPLSTCRHVIHGLFRHSAKLKKDDGLLRKLRLRMHPDRFSADAFKNLQPTAEELFKIVNALWTSPECK